MLEEQRGFIHCVSPYLGCWFALHWTATSSGLRSQTSGGRWGHTGGEGARGAAQPGYLHIILGKATWGSTAVQHVYLYYLMYIQNVYNNPLVFCVRRGQGFISQ